VFCYGDALTARRLDLLIAIALVALCSAIYAQSAAFEFVGYDDEGYVEHNPVVSRGLAPGILNYAVSAYVGGNWHPLTVFSHALDVEVFGLEAGRHHAENVLLHILATLLLFGVFRKATGTVWRSALVAALFAVHPLHVEVVSWVSQRKTLLCAVFGLAALYCYIDYARIGGARRLAAVAGLLTASLLAKPMLVTFPLLVALFDVWPLGVVSSWRQARERAPAKLWLLIPILGIGTATWFAQRSSGAMAPLDVEVFLTVSIPNAVLSAGWYAAKFVWPVGLAVHYPHPFLPQSGGVAPGVFAIVASVVFIAAASFSAFALRKRAPWLAVGLAWWAIALLPVIGLVQVGTQGVADRYSYIPMIGGFVVFAWGLEEFRSRLGAPIKAVAALAVVVVVGLSIASYQQVSHWRDSLSLFSRAVDISPRDVTMLFNLGNAVQRDGRVDEAEALYRRALVVQPSHSFTQLNLAELLRERGVPEDRAEASELYENVLRSRPGNRRAVAGLAALESKGP